MKIIVNHIGYIPDGKKKVIVQLDKADDRLDEFCVNNAAGERIYTGKLSYSGKVANWHTGYYLYGDFSDLHKEGRYYITAGSLRSPEEAASAARRIAELMDGRTILIASSDFTHYGPSYDFMPYGKDAYGRIMAEDDHTADLLANGEAEEAWREGKERTICGIAPAAVVSAMAKRIGLEGKRGLGSSSADTTGDRENFVSYRTVLWR